MLKKNADLAEVGSPYSGMMMMEMEMKTTVRSAPDGSDKNRQTNVGTDIFSHQTISHFSDIRLQIDVSGKCYILYKLEY